MLFMVFWTWAKGLEDTFDGANHRNLREIVVHEKDMVIPGRALMTQDTQHLGAVTPLDEKTKANELGEADEIEFDLSSSAPRRPYENVPVVSEEQEKEVLFLLSELGEKRVALPRLSTCAVFHKMTSGQGVPHTFVGKY